MFAGQIINVDVERLLDFEYLCDVIRNNSVDRLAMTFTMMVAAPEKARDKDFLYKPSDSEEELIKASKMSRIAVGENMCTTNGSHYNWVKEVKEHLDEYIWVYNLLADAYSKEVLCRILLARFLLNESLLDPTYMPVEYFDWSVLRKRKNAVLVDCGAYDGDTVLSFVKNYGDDYKKIYAYEPTPETFQHLEKSTACIRDIERHNCGVGETEASLRFHSQSGESNYFGYGDSDSKDIVVPVVSLDNDIETQVTFIKMDIEGSELAALKGAKNHIINDKPQLAICVYHVMEDLRTIPRLIHSYNANQVFKLRNHQEHLAGELVFYADPYPIEVSAVTARRAIRQVDKLLDSLEAIREELILTKTDLQEEVPVIGIPFYNAKDALRDCVERTRYIESLN